MLCPYVAICLCTAVVPAVHECTTYLSTICCSVGADQNIFSKILAVFQIVGPMADNVDGIFGGYSPEPDPDYIKTPRQGLSSLGTHDITVMSLCFLSTILFVCM